VIVEEVTTRDGAAYLQPGAQPLNLDEFGAEYEKSELHQDVLRIAASESTTHVFWVKLTDPACIKFEDVESAAVSKKVGLPESWLSVLLVRIILAGYSCDYTFQYAPCLSFWRVQCQRFGSSLLFLEKTLSLIVLGNQSVSLWCIIAQLATSCFVLLIGAHCPSRCTGLEVCKVAPEKKHLVAQAANVFRGGSSHPVLFRK
jgi:hypothetical protein